MLVEANPANCLTVLQFSERAASGENEGLLTFLQISVRQFTYAYCRALR